MELWDGKAYRIIDKLPETLEEAEANIVNALLDEKGMSEVYRYIDLIMEPGSKE